MGDSDYCLRFYFEDWELFLYGAYGSNCDWTLDRFLERLGGDDMVGVVMRWLAWAMLFMALWGCAGAPAEEPLGAPAADVPVSEAPAEPSEASVEAAAADALPSEAPAADEEPSGVRRSESDEELLRETPAPRRLSREQQEELRQQQVQQHAQSEFAANLVPLWQLLQHMVHMTATAQLQVGMLAQQVQESAEFTRLAMQRLQAQQAEVARSLQTSHTRQMAQVLEVVRQQMSLQMPARGRAPATPVRAPGTPGMASAPGTPFGLVALNEGGEARATRRARCGVCSGCRTKTAVKERRPPCINWIPVEPLERDERGRFKRAAETTTETAAETATEDAAAPKRAVQFPKRPKKENREER